MTEDGNGDAILCTNIFEKETKMSDYDVIVVGAGPGGTAAREGCCREKTESFAA